MIELIPRERRILAPGAVHVPAWLTVDQQRDLVTACRGWAAEGPGIRAAALPSGARMSVRTVCLGWHWYPYRYSRTRDDQDGSPVTPLPGWLATLGRAALTEAYEDPDRARRYQPDIALINYYDEAAKMGLHRDSDEAALEPVVSLSIGAACLFRFGNTANRAKPWTDVQLHSGDLLVFGDESRLAYHGVPKLLAGIDVPDTGLASGRLNITLRVSGLDRSEREATEP